MTWTLTTHQIIAISTLLVTAAIIALELWISKRRDDVFSKVVIRRGVDPAVLHALTVHEAVRSGRLSSEDTVRLLHAEPDGQRNLSFSKIDRPDRVGDRRLKRQDESPAQEASPSDTPLVGDDRGTAWKS
jgi:hypothetical protein